MPRLKRSVECGIKSVRANAVPMFVLWAFAAALVSAYFLLPVVRAALEPVARFQRRYGVWAGFANQFVFCGVIPCLFRLTVRGVRTERPVLKSFLQSLWSGCWGVVYVGFYALQTRMFGDGNGFATLVAKTAFDEFVWAPLVPVPATAFFCLWLESDFSIGRSAARFRRNFVGQAWLANLLANWIVWIPPVLVIYSFPHSLQIQVLGLVGSFWTLVSLRLAKETPE